TALMFIVVIMFSQELDIFFVGFVKEVENIPKDRNGAQKSVPSDIEQHFYGYFTACSVSVHNRYQDQRNNESGDLTPKGNKIQDGVQSEAKVSNAETTIHQDR
ncbi:MAG TPA: hypothetical protein VFQ56_07580, partial [Flavobacterium sp.]|nr:hypothetical protein [Flavobacterium sp.]